MFILNNKKNGGAQCAPVFCFSCVSIGNKNVFVPVDLHRNKSETIIKFGVPTK
jgi:hypothetical protein